MPDQDQPVANPVKPYKAEPDKPPAKAGLPPSFFQLPYEQQEQYLQEPDKLPDVTTAQLGQAALTAAPYAAATVGGIATAGILDYLMVPWYLAIPARALVAGASGGAAEYGKQEAYKRNWWDTGELAPTSGAEERQRVLDQAWSQAWPELIGGGLSSFGEIRKAVKGAEYFPGGRMYGRGVGRIAQAPTVAERTPILRTGMKYGIGVTEEGGEKAANVAKGLNAKIDAAIKAKPSAFTPQQYTAEIKARFDKLRDLARNSGLHSVDDLEVIDHAERDFLINQGRASRRVVNVYDKNGKLISVKPIDPWSEPVDALRKRVKPLTAERIQELKKGTWQSVRRKTNSRGTANVIAGFNKYTNADLELDAEEEIGRSMRKLVGDRYGLHGWNEEEGHLFELERAIQKKAEVEGRKPLFNRRLMLEVPGGASSGYYLGEKIGGPSGGALGAGIGATSPVAAELLANPRVQARLGILRGRLAQPGFARATARATIPVGARGIEYAVGGGGEQPQGFEEADPSELPPEMREGGRGGLVEPPAPPRTLPPRTAYEPPVEQVPPRDRPVYERERPMKPRDQPLYNWRPEWARELASVAEPSVPLSLLHTVAAIEGSGRASEQQKVPPNLVRSSAGAVGLMQVMPDMHGFTAEELQDPRINITAAAQYLKYLNSKYPKRPGLVLAAYNAGEQAVKDAGYKVYNMKKETQDYVGNGLRMWAQLSLDPDSAASVIAAIPELLK